MHDSNGEKGVCTLRYLVINNVRCGNLIYCCYSVYESRELLSESIPSEDREETAVLWKRVSQPPVIGRWLIPPRARSTGLRDARVQTYGMHDSMDQRGWVP